MFVGSMPEFPFVNGDTEDVLVAWQMRYKDAPAFFAGKQYKLVLAPLRSNDGVAFSSTPGSTNLIQVAAIDDPDNAGQALVTFTLRAPWRTFNGRSGLHTGNLQLKNESGITDLAIVKGTIEKRPTQSEN